MYQLRRGIPLRNFSKRARSCGIRAFSMVKASLASPEPLLIHFYKNGQKFDVPEVRKIQNDDFLKAKNCSRLGSELSFTKDKAFFKFLSSINLESKDRDSISVARILAYNISNKVNKCAGVEGDIIQGVVKALQVILSIFSNNSLNLSDNSELISKAGRVFSKGADDISRIIDYVYSKKNRRVLVTKEVSGYMNQGYVEVVNSIRINSGHSSYHFINDQLNYRFEAKSPVIILSDNLDENLVKDALQNLQKHLKISKNFIFVAKNVDVQAEQFLLSCKEKFGLTVSLVNLSEKNKSSKKTFEFLKENLKNLGVSSNNSKYSFKTSKRVVMENNFTYFIDPTFENNQKAASSKMYQELIEVNLKSHDETWSHALKNNIREADSNLKDSLVHGILPDMNTCFDLANQELKEYYSENDDIQSGIEIVQEAIDSFTVAVKDDSIDERFSSFGEALNKSILE